MLPSNVIGILPGPLGGPSLSLLPGMCTMLNRQPNVFSWSLLSLRLSIDSSLLMFRTPNHTPVYNILFLESIHKPKEKEADTTSRDVVGSLLQPYLLRPNLPFTTRAAHS